ncbi:MAG: hypothetical protein DLM73_10835 [Chthoniobacterales bacterium]|nr:MAG: hypothetical protein DLM73_10835 [Chthoniobacterales bacterium]
MCRRDPIPLPTGKLANPTLELRDANGNLVRADDNWRTGGQETEIIQSGVASTNDLESALIERFLQCSLHRDRAGG